MTSVAQLEHYLEEHLNRPGMSGDSSSWKGWGHVRWFIEEVPAGAA
ncbi:C-terminal truncated type I restriction/modification system DNA methylase HsdM [Mycobacterium tuberculosis]|nr:C-terminal truncated type I restriction/modification system DNA methylase HsdM [Mycobacterium tuberculosis]